MKVACRLVSALATSRGGRVAIPPLLIAALAVAAIPIIATLVSNTGRQKASLPPIASTTIPSFPPDFNPQKYENKDNQHVPTIAKNASSLAPESKHAITAKVFDWSDRLLTENNTSIYPSSLQCDKTGKCNQGTPNNASVFAAVWSRFQRYKLTKSADDLKSIVRDLNTFTNRQIVQGIQNDFWGCRLIFELWQSSLPELDQTKNQLQTLCRSIANNPNDLNEIDKVIAQNQFQEANLDEILQGKASGYPLQSKKDYYLEYAGLSSEYVSRYLWFSDKRDLARAKLYFAKAGAGFDLKDTKQKMANLPAFGVAALDLYKATQNSKYLGVATLLMKEKQKDGCESLLDCALTAFFAQEYFQVSQNVLYKTVRDRMLETAVTNGYDEEGYLAYINGVSAFHLFPALNAIYPEHENFLLAGMLMKQ